MQASCKNLRPVSHVPPPSVSFSSAASESSLKLPFVSIPCRFHLVAGEMSLSRGSPWFPQQSSFISNAILVIIIIITMFIITVSICIPKKKKFPVILFYFILFYFCVSASVQRESRKNLCLSMQIPLCKYGQGHLRAGENQSNQKESFLSFFLPVSLSVCLSLWIERIIKKLQCSSDRVPMTILNSW